MGKIYYEENAQDWFKEAKYKVKRAIKFNAIKNSNLSQEELFEIDAILTAKTVEDLPKSLNEDVVRYLADSLESKKNYVVSKDFAK